MLYFMKEYNYLLSTKVEHQFTKDKMLEFYSDSDALLDAIYDKLISVCSLSNLFFRFHTTTLTEACSNELKQHHL